jgi:hypothetical protein
MAQTQFARLKVGQKFIYKGVNYTKIKDIKKRCCIVLYNAVSDSDEKVKLPLHVLVNIDEI